MDNLTHATLSENLNGDFEVRVDDSTKVKLVLFEVSELRDAPRNHFFSVLFRGPAESMLPQGLYAMENESMGRFEIFIVPVGVTEAGYEYEAVFNRIKPKTS